MIQSYYDYLFGTPTFIKLKLDFFLSLSLSQFFCEWKRTTTRNLSLFIHYIIKYRSFWFYFHHLRYTFFFALFYTEYNLFATDFRSSVWRFDHNCSLFYVFIIFDLQIIAFTLNKNEIPQKSKKNEIKIYREKERERENSDQKHNAIITISSFFIHLLCNRHQHHHRRRRHHHIFQSILLPFFYIQFKNCTVLWTFHFERANVCVFFPLDVFRGLNFSCDLMCHCCCGSILSWLLFFLRASIPSHCLSRLICYVMVYFRANIYNSFNREPDVHSILTHKERARDTRVLVLWA